MALKKVEYVNNQTVITAENMNAIQDAIIALENSSGGNADQSGLSATVKHLLVTILRNGVYSTNQSINITALERALASSESGDDSGNTGETHTHSYISSVTKAATCETAGVRTYVCSCGETYTEEIPATGHNYVDGVCANCGAVDPDADTGENNGWVNGEPYAIEWTDGYSLNNTGAETESTNMSVSNFLPCQNVSRMVTSNLYSNYQLWYYDADKNFLRKAPISYVINQTNIETYRDAHYVRTYKRLATTNASVVPYYDDLLDDSTAWEANKYYRLNWADGKDIDGTTGEEKDGGMSVSDFALCYGAASLQFSNAARSFINWYDADKQYISYQVRQNVTTAVTIPDGACYFRLSNNTTGCNFWVQLS